MKYKIPKIVFSDFDGTLTDHTEFSPKFLDILNLLDRKNIPLIIVTGRSVSWAHFFITHFKNLSVVISEGGGVISKRGESGLIRDEYQVPKQQLTKLKNFSSDLMEEFKISLSADSIGRVSDRAIELIDLKDIALKNKITKLMDENKINYSTSNVHLNFWCGDISKYNAVKKLMDEDYSKIKFDDVMYFGDSLNDQSMFKMLDHSVGVSNIALVLEQMTSLPNIILEGEHNSGPNGVLNYLSTLLK